jgi:hypothetical protein
LNGLPGRSERLHLGRWLRAEDGHSFVLFVPTVDDDVIEDNSVLTADFIDLRSNDLLASASGAIYDTRASFRSFRRPWAGGRGVGASRCSVRRFY